MKRNNIEGLRLAQTGTYISGSLQVGNSLNATSIPGYTTSLYGPTA